MRDWGVGGRGFVDGDEMSGKISLTDSGGDVDGYRTNVNSRSLY